MRPFKVAPAPVGVTVWSPCPVTLADLSASRDLSSLFLEGTGPGHTGLCCLVGSLGWCGPGDVE